MERSKRNTLALTILVVILLWAWVRSKEGSDQDSRTVVRHRPPTAQRYETKQYRPTVPGIAVPALPEVNFDVLKVHSSMEPIREGRPDIQISELFYHPPGSLGEDAEFIELHHTGEAPLDMGSWSFTKGIDFVFPEDTVLAPGETIIICKDATIFRKTFGEVPKVFGVYEGGLKNSGETIRLKDREGSAYLTIDFGDKAPWPASSDGGGDSLQLKEASSNPVDPTQWVSLPPTPGKATFLEGEKPATSIFGVFQQPRAPTSTDPVSIQASISLAERDTNVQLHLEINGEFYVHEIETSEHFQTSAASSRLKVNLPPLPENTVVRYWFATEDSQGHRLRFPPLGRLTPNEVFWVQGPEVASKLPVYHLMMLPQDMMQMHSSPRQDQTFPATFMFDGEVYDQVKVRVRGAFARSWPKKSLKIFFNKDKLFQRESRLNLNSGWRDPSLIREHLSYRIYDMSESYSLKTQHVRLQVNGDFWGLFTTIRQPDKRYLEDQNLKGAALYKADSRRAQSDERMFHSEHEYEGHYEKETREEDSYADLADFCSELARTDDVARFFEQRVQVARYINFLCAGTLCQNWDGFNKNHFIGFDTGNTGRAFALPWDLDRTLGDYWDWSFDHHEVPLYLGAADQPGVTGWNRMADRLFNTPSLRALYVQRLKQLVDDVFTEEVLFAEIDMLTDQIGPEGDLDRNKWGGEPDWRGGVQQVKNYIKHRRDFLLHAIENDQGKLPSL